MTNKPKYLGYGLALLINLGLLCYIDAQYNKHLDWYYRFIVEIILPTYCGRGP